LWELGRLGGFGKPEIRKSGYGKALVGKVWGKNRREERKKNRVW